MRTFTQKQKPPQQTKSANPTRSGWAFSGQTREVRSILHLQRTIGNHAVLRLLQSRTEDLEEGSLTSESPRFTHDFGQIPVYGNGRAKIQPKLTASTLGDIYEQEADRVADQVMRMAEPQLQRDCACGEGCPKCREENSHRPHLQTKPIQSHDAEATLVFPMFQEVVATPRQSLGSTTREFMESRFGHDFSGVRVHTDTRAAASAQAINAHAYTVGNHIVFGASRYAPRSVEGRRLLAHELTHVVQQSANPVPAGGVKHRNNHIAGKLKTLTKQTRPVIQRQETNIRSPVFDEFVTQYSTLRALDLGRKLTAAEIKHVSAIYGRSIDYSRVRLMPTEGKSLDWRTVGNTIRLPRNYSLNKEKHRWFLIHEMAHVYQYQHQGIGVTSGSLVENITAIIKHGFRNAAYGCKTRGTPFRECVPKIVPGKKFFEYNYEHQAMIASRYYEVLRLISTLKLASTKRIALVKERNLLQPLIDQMRAALPLRERGLLMIRARDVMTSTPRYLEAVTPRSRRLLPIKPVFEYRF